LRLGTRGSELARTQSATVAAALERVGVACELTVIKTSGDQNTTSTFASIGPQGVFVREIEQALVEERIELAVHSFKDLPTNSPAELVVAAVPPRVDPADLLLVRRDALAGAADDWLPLAPGARVGTASARRRAWLEHFRRDLVVEPLRGNVPTRVLRLAEGRFDAIVLAAAGVERLQADQHFRSALTDVVILRLEPKRFVPAPAQGALAVQCRRGDARVLEALAALDDAPSRAAVTAERDALARAEGGCDVAFGAYCAPTGRKHELVAMLERGGAVHTARVEGVDASTLGAAAWTQLDAEVRR
jgi:hydroxymethylbilane synthase